VHVRADGHGRSCVAANGAAAGAGGRAGDRSRSRAMAFFDGPFC